MAIKIAARKPKQTGSRGSSGGSKWGAMIGAAVAVTAVAASGGTAAPVLLAAAGSGVSLGGMAGGALDPAKADSRQAISRRVGGGLDSGEDSSVTMTNALHSLKQINNPEMTAAYAPILAQGLIKTSIG